MAETTILACDECGDEQQSDNGDLPPGWRVYKVVARVQDEWGSHVARGAADTHLCPDCQPDETLNPLLQDLLDQTGVDTHMQTAQEEPEGSETGEAGSASDEGDDGWP